MSQIESLSHLLLPNGSAVNHQPTRDHDPQRTPIESARRAVERANGALTGRVNGEVQKVDLIVAKRGLRGLRLLQMAEALTPEQYDETRADFKKRERELKRDLNRRRKNGSTQPAVPSEKHATDPITVFSRQPDSSCDIDSRQDKPSREEVLKQLQLLNAERRAKKIPRDEYTKEHQLLVRLLSSAK